MVQNATPCNSEPGERVQPLDLPNSQKKTRQATRQVAAYTPPPPKTLGLSTSQLSSATLYTAMLEAVILRPAEFQIQLNCPKTTDLVATRQQNPARFQVKVATEDWEWEWCQTTWNRRRTMKTLEAHASTESRRPKRSKRRQSQPREVPEKGASLLLLFFFFFFFLSFRFQYVS